jgi:CHAT domain-containing protein
MEAEEVVAIWNGRAAGSPGPQTDAVLLTGERAREEAFKRHAPGRRVLHLATHGFFAPSACLLAPLDAMGLSRSGPSPADPLVAGENPLLLSGLALTGANRRDQRSAAGMEDGILTAEEVASLDLRGVEWAVLSGCDTGAGPVLSGEGVLGLRRTFAIAGARTLILSLWSIDDQAGRTWIRGLYEARLSGLSTPAAVRKANLDAIQVRRRAGVTTHPFFWGPFVASGDWR